MKKCTKLFALLLSAVVLAMLFAACAATPAEPAASDEPDAFASETREIVDSYGRTVNVPTKINTILPFGTSSLRLVCYLGAEDMVTCVDESQQDPRTINVSVPYKQVFAEKFADLPAVGKYSGGYITYNEQIIATSPDVIFVTYFDLQQIETLQEQTGIPVVGLKITKGLFDDEFTYSMELLGDLLGKEDRATELINYIDEITEDLNNRTKDIPEAEKKTVYSGAMTYYGQHGIQQTMANCPQIAAINAINVADSAADKVSESGTYEADMEMIQKWNPDVIFIDPYNLSLVNDEYKQNPAFFESLDSVKNGEVYSQPAYIRDGFNIELALIDCYFAGICVYPERFDDLDIAIKAKEIFEKFVGVDLYSQFATTGMPFDKITIGE